MDEDQKLEQEALAKIDPETIKTEIITEFGFDETDDAERIEKAVAREVKTRTFAAKAIGSKIKTREDFENFKKQNVPKPPVKQENNVSPEDLDKTVDAKVAEKLEKRDLDDLGYPDDIKNEIAKVSKILGVSIKRAAQDPYIQSKVESYEKQRKADEAAISRTNKSGGKKTFSWDTPPDVDMTTPEGVKEWEAWKVEMKKQGH